MNYNELVLASTSPRRIEILGNTGIAFRTEASTYEEDMTLPMQAHELVRYLATGKASEVSGRFPEDLVIGGDTFIVHEGNFLGKPKSDAEAKRTLLAISDETVEVISGIALLHGASGFEKTFHEVTTVEFRQIPEAAIDMYIKTGIPFDRAGAFGVQDIGGRFINEIRGDHFNLMGLPLFRLLDELYEIDKTLLVQPVTI